MFDAIYFLMFFYFAVFDAKRCNQSFENFYRTFIAKHRQKQGKPGENSIMS